MTNKFNSLDDSQLNISGGQIDKKKLLKRVGIIAGGAMAVVATVGAVVCGLGKFGKLDKFQETYNSKVPKFLRYEKSDTTSNDINV